MSADREAGSATVEFTLVSVLATTIFLAVLQVGMAIHVRNTLIAAAAEGARYGAAADRSPTDAEQRTAQLVAASLPGDYAQEVHAGYETTGGVTTVIVEVTAPLPTLGLIGPTGALTVQAHALVERAP